MDSFNFTAPLSAHSRANTAIIMLCIFLLFQGLVLVLGTIEFLAISAAVNSGTYSTDGMEAIFAIKGLLGIGHALLFIATGVVVLMWVHRACRVLVERGIRGMEFTPGWAVGWFFVPVANLYRPYLAVKEIWLRSDPAGLDRSPTAKAPTDGVVWFGAWWMGWVIGGGLDLLASVAFQRATNVILYYGALKMALLSDVVFAATTALLIVVISKIDNRQAGLSTRQVQPPIPTQPIPEPVN